MPGSPRKLVTKLAAKYRQLTFCYEAGPTEYGLYRLIRKLGHDCIAAAPSLIPKKPGDRVKTNRRGARVVPCRARHSLAGDARDRSRCGSDGAGRDRRSVALSKPPRVDGVSRSRTL